MSRLRLREVRLSGFKTFADKTTIAFTPGITAIVGPNGSGKSNIVDALRWALGVFFLDHIILLIVFYLA